MEHKKSLILIGMPGSGKSTLGQLLAKKLGRAFIDTDLLIESLYAMPLQKITDMLPREDFLNVESKVICALTSSDSVIATGGSVIYRPEAMEHLKSLGQIIYLHTPLHIIKARISQKPDRGISFGPGQTIEDLFAERSPLYLDHANLTIDTNELNPEECAEKLASL